MVMAWKCREQEPGAKEAFQIQFNWNLKMKTLCIQTMEELLSFRCHKSSTSLSFLFLVSLPFLYNLIKNWKIKIIFTVSMWSV